MHIGLNIVQRDESRFGRRRREDHEVVESLSQKEGHHMCHAHHPQSARAHGDICAMCAQFAQREKSRSALFTLIF